MDALVIMHVHDRDVFNSSGLKEKYSDYETPFTRDDYAAVRLRDQTLLDGVLQLEVR